MHKMVTSFLWWQNIYLWRLELQYHGDNVARQAQNGQNQNHLKDRSIGIEKGADFLTTWLFGHVFHVHIVDIVDGVFVLAGPPLPRGPTGTAWTCLLTWQTFKKSLTTGCRIHHTIITSPKIREPIRLRVASLQYTLFEKVQFFSDLI